MATEIEPILLLAPGTVLTVQWPLGPAGLLRPGQVLVVRRQDRDKTPRVADAEVIAVGPGARPTQRAVTFRIL